MVKKLLKELEKMTRMTYHQKSAQQDHLNRMGDVVRAIEKVLGFRK